VAGSGCSLFTDVAEIIEPGGVITATTVSFSAGVLVTVQYPLPTPAGEMPEGVYTLVKSFSS
jgi:hypothetical protein